jgi:pyrroloquinoline quinone (PQQ) biosynthesis protein C
MNYLVHEEVEREEAGETEGAILKYIRTADDRRAAEDSMREMHRLLSAYATGLAREYLAATLLASRPLVREAAVDRRTS